MFPYLELASTAMASVEVPAPADEPAVAEGLEYVDPPEAGDVEMLVGADALEVLVEDPHAATVMAMPTAIAAPAVLLIKCTFLAS